MINAKSPSFGTKPHYLTKIAQENWKIVWEKLGLDQHLIPYTRINSEWMNELNIKKEMINKLSDHMIVYLSDLSIGKILKPSMNKKKLQKVKLIILITLN